MKPWICRLLLGILLTGAYGCGGTATVAGKVRYQGRPVTYGSVIFLSSDSTVRSGVIEPDGSYIVAGVHTGEVKIGVISHDPSKGRSIFRSEKSSHRVLKGSASGKTATKDWFPLPPKFENPESSGLGCTVGSGRVSYDIDIK